VRSHVTLIVTYAGLAVLGACLVWLLVAGDAFENLGPVLPWMVAGALAVAALTGGLMWLAFFSSRRGYDEPYDVNRPNDGRRR
jgi:hypothetical protein